MQIDENTKVIGRFHKIVSPRSLNIYNPFFQEVGINAVFLLFYNQNPKVLIDGFKSLNLAGAITAGFEQDPVLPTLLDSLDKTAQFMGRIGSITNENGKVVGHAAQAGRGMLRTIKHIINPQNKEIVIVGAGNIAKGLLFEIEQEKIDCKISIYNRTIENAQKLKDRFSMIRNVKRFDELNSASGDLFVNLTHIGGRVTDVSYPETLISQFANIVDVTFETEDTELIRTAKKLKKNISTGWDMFTFQGQVTLEEILHQEIDSRILRKHVAAGLSQTVK